MATFAAEAPISTPSAARDPARVSNVALGLLGLFAAVLSIWVVWDFLLPIAVAAFLAALLHPVHAKGRRRFDRHPRLYSLLFTFAVLVLIVAPVGLLAWLLVTELLSALRLLRDALGPGGLEQLAHGHLPGPVQHVLSGLQRVVPFNAESLRHQLGNLSRYVAPTLGTVLAFSGVTVFDLFVMLLTLFYLFLDGERLASWLIEILPLRARYSRELFAEFRKVSFGMIIGSAATMVIAGVLAWLGYRILGVSDALVWGTLTGALPLAPAVGSAIVWVPVAIVEAVSGHLVRGLLLTGYFLLVVVLGADNLVRSLIVGRQMTLHPLLALLGIFGGVVVFGFAGFVVGPMILALTVALLNIYRRDFVHAPAKAQPGGG